MKNLENVETFNGILGRIGIIRKFPMPPSINAQLKTSKRFRGLSKTKVAVEYDKMADLYCALNRLKLNQLNKVFSALIDKKMMLVVDAYFVFDKRRLFSQTKKAKDLVKVLDANNRLKSALDWFSKAIKIDDKFIFAGNCEKINCNDPADEQVIFIIRAKHPRTLEEIEHNIKWERVSWLIEELANQN